MAHQKRHMGLSRGADICWAAAYEEIVKELKLDIPVGKDRIAVHVSRVTIEPFNLQQSVRYDVVVDRLTHWMQTTREWIKKAVLMDGLYVLNNPWTLQSMEKHTTYAAMLHLGLPVPETVMLPPKTYSPDLTDAPVTLRKYAKLFDLGEIGSVGLKKP